MWGNLELIREKKLSQNSRTNVNIWDISASRKSLSWVRGAQHSPHSLSTKPALWIIQRKEIINFQSITYLTDSTLLKRPPDRTQFSINHYDFEAGWGLKPIYMRYVHKSSGTALISEHDQFRVLVCDFFIINHTCERVILSLRLCDKFIRFGFWRIISVRSVSLERSI